MASSAVMMPQVNGVPAILRPESAASIHSNKRKRDPSDDGEAEVNGHDISRRATKALHEPEHQRARIREFFDVLQSVDDATRPVLKRPLPESNADDEPSAKKFKPVEGGRAVSIHDKFQQGAYDELESLLSDVTQAVDCQVMELGACDSGASVHVDEEGIASALMFKRKALEHFRRESDPLTSKGVADKTELHLPPSSTGALVLSTHGAVPNHRPLFTSLAQAHGTNGRFRAIPDKALPNGVSVMRVAQTWATTSEKPSRTLTLGEVFPSPRGLPPLQPPKAPKNVTKGNVLSFYHPELSEKSRYRTGTYFSQTLSTGIWLDYSNATATTHPQTKLRERAQSLAGVKPSSSELETSELDALFRSAFSSFAPCKDDSAALVTSGQVSQAWWQRVGRRSFERMVEASEANVMTGEEDEADEAVVDLKTDVDEEAIQDAIDNWDQNWDDMLVDPSLEMRDERAEKEKEVDELLEEISEMIETLSSYQRNRNLALPTSQDRYSADPVNGDMLRNGGHSQQASEEEQATYETLKAQLALVIQMLPPYAVARLNSDRLEELAVSRKIEIRTDEYHGVMEDDEPTRLAKIREQAGASQRQAQVVQRTTSLAAGGYNGQQFAGQYGQPPRSLATPQHNYQTPTRSQPYQAQRQSVVPVPQLPHQTQARPPQGGYRPSTGNYGTFTPQLAKVQGTYGHANVTSYAASPTQARQTQPAQAQYANIAQAGAHNAPPYQGYPPAGYQSRQVAHPPLHQAAQQVAQQAVQQHAQGHMQHTLPPPPPLPLPPHQQQPQPQPPYQAYTNGGPMRTMSPQVPAGQQLPHQYGQATPPPQHQVSRPPYTSPRRQFAGSAQPALLPGGPSGPSGPSGRPPNHAGYQPGPAERQPHPARYQADAQQQAQQRTLGQVAKMQMGTMSPSPNMAMHMGPSPVNGTLPTLPPLPALPTLPTLPPAAASPMPLHSSHAAHNASGVGMGFPPA